MRVFLLLLPALVGVAQAESLNYSRDGTCIHRHFGFQPKNDILLDASFIEAALDNAVGSGASARNVEGYGSIGPGLLPTDETVTYNARGRTLRRLTENAYADGLDQPRGTCAGTVACMNPKANQLADGSYVGSNLPNPRLLSTRLSTLDTVIPSPRGLSDFTTHWGQLIAHDVTLVPPDASTESVLNIVLPKGDSVYDPDRTGDKAMVFGRAVREQRCSGAEPRGRLLPEGARVPREQSNEISSLIDGTTVYGGVGGRQNLLRGGAADPPGSMRVSAGNMLPLAEPPVASNRSASTALPLPGPQYFAGDVRTNEVPMLTMTITLLVREHNRLAAQHVKWLRAHGKSVDSDVVFAWAQKMVIATIQAITYHEWLPALFGEPFRTQTSRRTSAIADLFTEFTTATQRFGHSIVNGFIPLIGGKNRLAGKPYVRLADFLLKSISLANNEDGGIEPMLRGILCLRSQKVDTIVTPDLQNRLFALRAGEPERDLVAVNIMRARDHGVADYNSVRVALGLKPFTRFRQINPGNPKLTYRLADIYGSIDRVDLFVGALAEAPALVRGFRFHPLHRGRAEFGETIRAMLDLQYSNIRDADRFFFTRILTRAQVRKLSTLSQIVSLNSEVKNHAVLPRRHSIFFNPLFCHLVFNFQCVKRRQRLHNSECDAVYRNIPDLATSGDP